MMALALQVVSSHHLGALDIEKALSVQELLVKRLLPHAASEAETERQQLEQDAARALLAQQTAALERLERRVTEQKVALKQEVQRVAQAIDALSRTVEG